MAEVTMTLYEALESLKRMRNRLNRSNSNLQNITTVRKTHQAVTLTGVNLEKYTEEVIRPTYQQNVALFNNYIALKCAVNAANARITIEIDGNVMSIATAIVRMRELDKEMDMYTEMLKSYEMDKKRVDVRNNDLLTPEKISDYVSRTLGSGKRDIDIVQRLERNYREEVEVEVYDPLNIHVLCEKKLEELLSFKQQVNFKLNQANVNNNITVVYPD